MDTTPPTSAFAPFLSVRAVVRFPDGVGPVEAMVSVVAGDPLSETAPGAARSEAWSVSWKARPAAKPPARGTLVSFPDRPDLPVLYVQRCHLLGGLYLCTCTSRERLPA